MALDTRIPLMVESLQLPSPVEVEKAREYGDQIRARNAMRQVFSDPNAVDMQTGNINPNAIRQVMQADPSAGMSLLQHMQQNQLRNAQLQNYNAIAEQHKASTAKAQLETQTKVMENAYPLFAGLDTVYTKKLKDGASPEEARAAAIAWGTERHSSLSKSGVLGGNGKDVLDDILAYNPETNAANLRTKADVIAQNRAAYGMPKSFSFVDQQGQSHSLAYMPNSGSFEELGVGPKWNPNPVGGIGRPERFYSPFFDKDGVRWGTSSVDGTMKRIPAQGGEAPVLPDKRDSVIDQAMAEYRLTFPYHNNPNVGPEQARKYEPDWVPFNDWLPGWKQRNAVRKSGAPAAPVAPPPPTGEAASPDTAAIKSALTKAGKPYEPDKYEYRIKDGVVQMRKKGG